MLQKFNSLSTPNLNKTQGCGRLPNKPKTTKLTCTETQTEVTHQPSYKQQCTVSRTTQTNFKDFSDSIVGDVSRVDPSSHSALYSTCRGAEPEHENTRKSSSSSPSALYSSSRGADYGGRNISAAPSSAISALYSKRRGMPNCDRSQPNTIVRGIQGYGGYGRYPHIHRKCKLENDTKKYVRLARTLSHDNIYSGYPNYSSMYKSVYKADSQTLSTLV